MAGLARAAESRNGRTARLRQGYRVPSVAQRGNRTMALRAAGGRTSRPALAARPAPPTTKGQRKTVWCPQISRLVYLKRYDETGKGQHEYADLTGQWRTSAVGQRGHFHPLLTPDRKWMLFAADGVDAGPKPAGTQLFLLDVSDLTGTDLVGDAVRKNQKLIVSERKRK